MPVLGIDLSVVTLRMPVISVLLFLTLTRKMIDKGHTNQV
jgi:TRAP-type C4-dicarboxylate transport system permease small subunit